jgi:uncharacterized protein YbjT (DUF2867 family)
MKGTAEMILVVGGTGLLGQKVVRLLLADGHRVRVMTRDPARAVALARQGAEIVLGDLTDPGSLPGACGGISRLFVAAHALVGRGRNCSDAVDDAGHRALIDAAVSAGVARFVYTSALGASPGHPIDFFRTKFAIEQYLARSGLDYSVLRPSAFMEWHAHAVNGRSILKSGRTTLFGTGTKLRNFVAARDVAHCAVEALTAGTVRRRMLEVGGPGNYCNNEVAAMYARSAGIDLRVVHVPLWVAATLARLIRPIHPGISRVLRLASLPDTAFSETFDSRDLLRAYPQLRPTTLQDFVQTQVKAAQALDQSASAHDTA